MRFTVALTLVMTLLLLLGCRRGARRVASASELQQDEVLLVGRVELEPPLAPGEQIVGRSREKDMIYLLLGDEWRGLRTPLRASDHRGHIVMRLGELYTVAVPARDRYVLGATIWMVFPSERVYLPAGLRIPIRSGDRALYIGTLHYCRDRFFNITHALLIDDYARDRRLYARGAGSDAASLRRRLPETIDGAGAGRSGETGLTPLVRAPPGASCAHFR